MRPLHLARLEKTRPVLVLTRELVRPHLRRVTVVPITSTVWGLSSEVTVGVRNGLDHDSVVNLDNILTIPVTDLGRLLGFLHADQERALSEAIIAAFDLESPPATDVAAV